MTIEKRPNATADKNAPTQAPALAPAVERGVGPKLPGPPGVPGTERFRLLAYVKQESMVRVDKRPDDLTLLAQSFDAMRIRLGPPPASPFSDTWLKTLIRP